MSARPPAMRLTGADILRDGSLHAAPVAVQGGPALRATGLGEVVHEAGLRGRSASLVQPVRGELLDDPQQGEARGAGAGAGPGAHEALVDQLGPARQACGRHERI